MTTTAPIKSKVYGRLNKEPDVQLHIKVTKADGLELVDLRDFIVSLKQYGRGILFESRLLPQVIEELVELQRQIGTTPYAMEGEQKLPGMEGF